MTGAKFRNWLMFWLFHKTQPFNFKEKTLPLESVSWHGMKPFLNYAKKCGYSPCYCRKAYAIYYAKQSIFSSSMGGFKMSITEKLQSLKAISTRLREPPSKVHDTPLKILYEAGLEKIEKLGRQKIKNV